MGYQLAGHMISVLKRDNHNNDPLISNIGKHNLSDVVNYIGLGSFDYEYHVEGQGYNEKIYFGDQCLELIAYSK